MRPLNPISKYATIILVFMLAVIFSFRLESDIRIEKILHQLELFRLTRTQQKIYLQSDKQVYKAGQNIWLKAYVIEASGFKCDTLSKEVYIDLIDFNNHQVFTQIIKNRKGLAQGYLALSDTLAEGNYQIRAYTNWMRNFDESFFFKKTIQLINPNYSRIITKSRLKAIQQYNRRLKNKETDRVVAFFPEGGWMVSGLTSVVAFKAENLAGQGMNIKGEIFEEKGALVTSFQSAHEGMGTFQITPSPNKKYYAKVYFEDGESKKIMLPEILPAGTVTTINNDNPGTLHLHIASTKPVSNDEFANDFIIIGQSRGLAPYVSKVRFQGKPISVDIDKNLFPTGIVQFTVFDNRSNPICERLVFIKNPENFRVNTGLIKEYQHPDSFLVRIVLKDQNAQPLNGQFSLSVTDKDQPESYASNIVSHFYLSSDLKGWIKNPGYYFDNNEPEAMHDLDNLLLTQGWRRYLWPELLSNHLSPILYQPSEGLAIGGIITKDLFGIPINDSKVKLTILSSYNDVYETITDRLGHFNFPDLPYEDTISVKIEAFKPTGGKGVQIILTDTLIPETHSQTPGLYRNDIFSKSDIRSNNRKEHLAFNKNYKGKPEPDIAVPKIHNTPNDVIYVGEDASSYTNIFQYLQGRVPGVNIVGTKVQIRGISSIYLPTDPLYLIDGVPVDAAAIAQVPVQDIYVVEILKGPEAAIYGSRGANGVIAVYTKHGKFGKRGVIEFGMQGYQKEKEFYTEQDAASSSGPAPEYLPVTLYWNPKVILNENGEYFIKIKKSSKVKSYNFVFEGLTSTNEPVYYRFSY